MVESLEDDIIKDLHNILANSTLKRPLDILEPLFSYVYENNDLTMILISDHGDISFLSKLIDIVKLYCFDIWKKQFKTKDDKIYDIYFKFITSGFLGVLDMWYSNNMDMEPHELAVLIDEIISEGFIKKE